MKLSRKQRRMLMRICIAAALLVAIITAASVLVGMICGYRLGCGPMNKFVTVGGCLVLIGGAAILAHYLMAR